MNRLSEIFEGHLRRLKEEGATQQAIDGHRCVGRRFIRWLETTQGVVGPEQMRPEHIQAWLLFLRGWRTQAGLPLQAITVIAALNQVKAFCRRLVREGRLPRLMIEDFPKIRRPQLLPRLTPVHAELKKMLRKMPTDTPDSYMLRAIAEVLYSSGMRPCELLALDVGDVDFSHGLAKVTGKRKRERMVPLGRTALRFLETYLHGVRPLRLRAPDQRALWLNSLGRRLSYETLVERLHRPIPSQPARRLTCYTLRRACATELIRSGASVWAVKELLGHEELEATKHYVQLTITDLQKTHARCHPRDQMPDAQP